MAAEVDAGNERRSALAVGDVREAPRGRLGDEQGVELVHPLLEREHLVRARDEEVGVPAVAAHHLDREAADVAHLDLAPVGQLAPLALEPGGVRLGREDRALDHLHDLDDLRSGLGRRGWRENGSSSRPGIVAGSRV